MLTNDRKSLYQSYCQTYTDIPLYLQSWWLDIVAGRDWDFVSITDKTGELLSLMPYSYVAKFGFTKIKMPKYTQSIGPWINLDYFVSRNKKYNKREILGKLFDQLPSYDSINIALDPIYDDWLPLYWRNYSQTTFYTYHLSLDTNDINLWNNLQGSARREINKSRDRYGLEVNNSKCVETFLNLNRMTFTRQGKSLGRQETILKNLLNEGLQRDKTKIFTAIDPSGNPHSSVAIFFDSTKAYYIAGGSNPKLRTSGAATLCLWHAILDASKYYEIFDFEGSMIEAIERFIRTFGASSLPYSRITATPNRYLRLLQSFR